MPLENKRMKYTLEEVLGHMPVPDEELEITRTNNMADSIDPNWESPFKKWSMGLRNSNDTKLANIINARTNSPFGISDFLDFVHRSQLQIFDFMYRVIDRLLSKEMK